MMTDRDRLVISTANSVICRSVYKLPVDVMAICKSYGIHMATKASYISGGYTEQDVFYLWGNKDGAAAKVRGVNTISYNEHAPAKRIRFTLAEELMHTLLRHTLDPRFDLQDQSYSAEVYAQYEAEAKHGAGMLLVPPSIYYKYRSLFNLSQIAKLCSVSHACAYTVAQYYEENEEDLKDLFTMKYIECDTQNMIPKILYRPLDIWPAEDGIL